ncbi:MAG TPA: class I SAM-dependent methyltransferase [Acetobacteraceae bacterium]|jgi:SAM-dependent methyltransferase|nr:class I SAM-dependent methyltransferase [Acetobacteraceae bacterium]
MAVSVEFEPHRFRTAARHYLAGRPAYAPRLIELVARGVGLAAKDRVLDLGCGPGMLAGAFEPLVGEVLAVDPEPEMLRIAEAEYGGGGRIVFRQGSSFDLSPAWGRFRLVTMGRSFHWMDRAETLRRLDAMIEPGGAVALFDSTMLDLPENGWSTEYRAVVRRYASADTNHVRHRGPEWVRHEAFLLDSAFNAVEQVSVIERRTVSVQQLVDRALSRSSTAPDRLGDAAPRLAEEIEVAMRPLAMDGILPEVVATSALLGRRGG